MKSRFLLFSASAGSGKTYNLAVQYIALLAANNEHEFSRTLAVTFTNKATAEMKDRILEQLYGISKGLSKSKGYLKDVQKELKEKYSVNITDKELMKRCAKSLKAILHDYSRFYVSTIDAFFQIVLRNMAHELGLNARLQVEIDDKEVIEMAVDNIIDGLQHNEQNVRPWLQAYINQQIQEGKKWDIRRNLKGLARMLFMEEYMKRALDTSNKSFDTNNIRAFRNAIKETLEKAMKPCKDQANLVLQLLDKASSENKINNEKYIISYATKIQKGDLDANFGTSLSGIVSDASLLFPAGVRKKIGQVPLFACQLAEAIDKLHKEQEDARSTVNTATQAMKHLSPMGLLGAIDEEVKRINNDNNRFSLAHTPILIRQMIQESDAPFVFEKIGTRFGNIMIDEFQDTSILQWENFKVLLMNNLSQGGLSMIVGDIKQSIYRWRNGDWRILHRLEQNGLPGFQTDSRPLNINFRSQDKIVTFNNEFFPKAAAILDELDPNSPTSLKELYANVKQSVREKGSDGGYVRIRIHSSNEENNNQDISSADTTTGNSLSENGQSIHLQSEDKQQGENENTSNTDKDTEWQDEMLRDMGEQITTLHTEYKVPYHEMAILIRKSKFIEKIINYFGSHMSDVKLVSNEAFHLRYSVAVNMIINALMALSESQKDTPNPVPLHYLAIHYRQNVLGEDFSFSQLCTIKPEEVLPPAFLSQSDSLRSLPLYELCEKIYRLFSLNKIPKQDAYLLCFFDELTAYLRENPSDIASFLQFWDETMSNKTIPSGEIDGIRILTIHSAKGLQYHTVFMPFCDGSIEKDRNDGLLWCHPTQPPFNQLGTLPVPTTSKLKDSAFANEYDLEHFNRRADELNVLYVAFTRAEHNLFVWGKQGKGLIAGKYDENIADLIAACLPLQEEFFIQGNPSSYQEHDEEKSENRIHPDFQKTPVNMCSYEGKIEFRQSRPAAEFVHFKIDEEDDIDEKQLSYIEKGKLLHFIFSQIETSDEVEIVAHQMLERGILSNKRQEQEVISLARRGLQNDTVRDWFSGQYTLFNERSILTLEEEEVKKRRPDRVMVSDNRIIVVDFKFGKPQKEHQEQVRNYINILQSMHSEKKVDGFLWYVYRNKVESV